MTNAESEAVLVAAAVAGDAGDESKLRSRGFLQPDWTSWRLDRHGLAPEDLFSEIDHEVSNATVTKIVDGNGVI